MKRIYVIGALAFLFSSCKPHVNITTPPSSGEATFTNYLAVGNSLTAGYADGSLTHSGQLNSYPQRLYEQFQRVGSVGPFIQPELTGDYGYPGPKLVLGKIFHCSGDSSLGPVPIGLPLDSVGSWHFTSTTNNGQINNIAVPGIRVADYPVAGYAAVNRYAARFYHNPAGSPLDELYYRVFNVHPTFFTLWLGANDILGFALAGGVGNGNGSAVPIGGGFYNTSDITPVPVFQHIYDTILTAITSISSSGAVINVPDVSSVPYFTTVPMNGLMISRQSQADSLKAYWSTSNFDKVFQVGANYFIVEDQNNVVRQAVPGELLLLNVPTDSLTCAGWGSLKPIPNKYVLTTDELQQIRNATASYNAFIKQECDLRRLAYVDMNAFMKTIASGFTYNGITYTTGYVSGGAFSLDGIHPTPRGYALIANYILQTINSFYKSTIPLTDVNKYPGINFP
jgi:lysophospholipase L1-like esterase